MSQSRFAYYPGCTLHGTAREYDVSARLVCKSSGIELEELEDWTCCGASSAHATDHLMAISLPARELQAAEEKDLPLVTACAMCFNRLKLSAHELSQDNTREMVSKVMNKEIIKVPTVVHLLQVVDEKIASFSFKKQLEGLKVACYYGCLLVRPNDITEFDDDENPQIMDRTIATMGAQAIDWDFKTACCGASLPFTHPEAVIKLSHAILSQAKELGADCVSVACPMCHANLDMNQKEIRSRYNDEINIPIFYFTQLMGLSLGFSPKDMLVDKHFTSPLPLLKEKGLV